MSSDSLTATTSAMAVPVAVATDGVFYAHVHAIADDNIYRITLIFASRDVADQWWRAVSTSTVSVVQNSIQRVTPQFYTHDLALWNVYTFFTDARITSISSQFRGTLFLVLENDRVGRGISILPPVNIVDRVSGQWFSIRSKSNPSMYWFYDSAQGFIVASNTHRTFFQVSGPDLSSGTIMIGSDDIVIGAQGYGYVNPTSSVAGGNLLGVGSSGSAVAYRFKFNDLSGGVFIPKNLSSGAAIVYEGQGAVGGWELAL